MAQPTEVLEGHVVDLVCIRKYPQAELAERAQVHTKACGLKGHCVESGYGLVDREGCVALLDSEATPMVVEALRQSVKEEGIKLRAVREQEDREMRTVQIDEVA